MKSYKVVYLILNGSPYGGSEKHVVDLFNTISRKNIESKLICSKGNPMIENIVNPNQVIPMGRGFIDFFKIVKILVKEKPDILHAHAARALLYARVAKFLLSLFGFHHFKLISTSHGLWVPPLKVKLQLHRFMHLLKNQDDLTLSVSKFSKTELINLGYNDSKVKYVYNGIDFSLFDAVRSIKEKVKNVAFVGRLTEQKGISVLMDLIRRESENKSDIKFEIYGSGHLEGYIKEFVKDNQLTNVFIKGHTNNVKEVFLNTDLLVAPSLDEGLPYTLVEAINCGLPVISTSVGGVPEVVENGLNGYLTEAGNCDEFYEAFSKIKSINLSSMSRESIKISQKFSIDNMIGSIENEYKECLK